MAEFFEVFIRSTKSMDQLANELSAALAINLRKNGEGGYESDYGGADAVDVGLFDTVDFADHDDMKLTAFNAFLLVRVLRGRTPTDYDHERSSALDLARLAFERFKSRGDCGLMLTRDTEEKLDEYWPSPPES
jgi:hypothetical protein